MGRPHKYQHTISAFYLTGFTPSQQPTDHLYVLDLRSGEWRHQRPGKVARHRDFYTAEGGHLPTTIVERDVIGGMSQNVLT